MPRHDFVLNLLQQTLLLGVGSCRCCTRGTQTSTVSGQTGSGGVSSGQPSSSGVSSGQPSSSGVVTSQSITNLPVGLGLVIGRAVTTAGARSAARQGSGAASANFLV
jgi:hypothetical protein